MRRSTPMKTDSLTAIPAPYRHSRESGNPPPALPTRRSDGGVCFTAVCPAPGDSPSPNPLPLGEGFWAALAAGGGGKVAGNVGGIGVGGGLASGWDWC